MTIKKLTTLLVVEAIEPCLAEWHALGYAVVASVPDASPFAFAVLAGAGAEIMLQTRASLADDLPAIAERGPSHLLYADVSSLAETMKSLPDATIVVPQRTTLYGATEIWVELSGSFILGLAEHVG